jgi:hypothetical protein
MVMPEMPFSIRAFLTSSNLKWRTIASIFFIALAPRSMDWFGEWLPAEAGVSVYNGPGALRAERREATPHVARS